MANKYVITAGGDWSNANTWDDTSSGGAGGDGKPGIGDIAILNSGSGNCTVDENSAVGLGGLTMTTYTGTLADDSIGRIIDVDGDTILGGTIGGPLGLDCRDNITIGSGTTISATSQITWNGAAAKQLTTNGVTLPIVVLNGTDTLTAQDAVTATSWDSSAGTHTYVDGTNLDHNIGGDLLLTAGSLTSGSDWAQTASGNLASDATARSFRKLTIGTGATAARTAVVYCKAASIEDGATLSGASLFRVYKPSAADFLEVLGTVEDGIIKVNLDSSLSNSKQVLMGAAGKAVEYVSDTDSYTWTQTAALTTSKLSIYSNTNTKYGKMVFSGSGHILTQVVLGEADTNARGGQTDFGGSGVTIGASGLAVGDDANTNVAVDFGSAYIANAGTIDLNQGGTNPPTLTCDDGACHIVGGSLTEAAAPGAGGELVHLHDVTIVGGNVHADYTRSTFAHPGTLGMMGVGI